MLYSINVVVLTPMKEARKKVVIDADRRSGFVNFREILLYKDLFLSLAYRDYRVRYAQTFLGFAWAVIQPTLQILIGTVIFSKALGVNTDGVAYPVFACSGLLLWSYFSYVLNNAGSSIIGAQGMVKKIYFPRLIIPLSKAVVGFVDFFIVLLIMIGLMIYYQTPISANAVWIPAFFLIAVLASLGCGIWLSALSIRYRDFQHIVPFVMQFGLYITPVLFTASEITQHLPEWGKIVYYCNPMAGIIDGFRWAMFGGPSPDYYQFISFGMALLIFLTSLWYFKRMEEKVADII